MHDGLWILVFYPCYARASRRYQRKSCVTPGPQCDTPNIVATPCVPADQSRAQVVGAAQLMSVYVHMHPACNKCLKTFFDNALLNARWVVDTSILPMLRTG